jgi:lycopene cyclase domain-containing protein
MNNLYLLINCFVLLGPLLLSFDKKVAFYKTWKALFPAQLIMMAVYIPWDMVFTDLGVWGFTPAYLTGITLGNLPIEELLFFITVPYACTFIYACVKAYFKLDMKGEVRSNILGSYATILLLIVVASYGHHYSFYTSLVSLITLIIFWNVLSRTTFWANFLVTYLIAAVPFMLVNGILTGSFIENEVVWYSSAHIFNLRIFTIPIEDSIYNFGMLLLTIGIYELLLKRLKK